MNYIKQLNAFHLKIDLEPVSIHARVLWYTLTDINNRLVWREEFTVAMSKLREKVGLSESTFKRARKELEVNGFIQVTTRKGNQSAMYHMVCLYKNATNSMDYIEDVEPQETQKSGDKLAHNMDGKLAPLIKHKQKGKQNNATTTTAALAFFQNNFGEMKPYVADDVIQWENDLGEALVLHAMKRAVERGKASWGYVKGILQAWARKGITSVEAAQKEESGYRKQHRPRSFTGSSESADFVPEWFKEQKRREESKCEEANQAMTQRDRDAELAEVERMLAAYRDGDTGPLSQ